MILELQNISFGFDKAKPLLNDVSISLETGRIYVLMGGNGAGKTTLFNIITGFLKPNTGKILFKDKHVESTHPYKINRLGIGRTFQDLRLIAKLTVRENVMLAMKTSPTDKWPKALFPQMLYAKELVVLEAQVEKIISQYFLSDVQNSLAGEISYGQQKLLNIACG